jgi:copper transport protein
MVTAAFRRTLYAALFLLTLGFAGFTPVASATAGNNEVISSNPAANQVVDVAPTQIQMVFRDPLASPEAGAEVKLVLACDGTLVGLAAPQLGADLKTVSVALTQIPPPGLCTVSWSLPDGSVGSFSFTSAIATETTVAGDATAIPDDGETVAVIGEVVPERSGSGPRVGGILGLLRIFEYLLVASLFGGLMIVLLAWPEGIEYGVCLRFFRLTWMLAVLVLYLVVVITAMRQTDAGFAASLNPFSWLSSLNYGSGYVLLLRFALVVGAVWVAFKPDRIFDPSFQVPSITLITLMMATYGLTRIGQNVPLLTYVFGIAHVLAIGLWIGALALLSRAVLAGPGDEDLVHAVRGVARLTTPLIVAASFTGVVQVYLLDGFSIFTTGHGLLNVFKVIVVSVMVWIALMLKVFTNSRLSRERELSGKMAWRLRRAVSVELIIGVVALGLTSWMVPMRPPQANASVSTPSVTYAFREELQNDRFRVIVSLTPATTGTNAMRIELLEPSRINNFIVKLIPQEPGYAGISITMPIKRRGAVIVPGDGTLNFNVPGVWSIEITGATTTGELIPLATTVTIIEALTPATTVPTESAPATTVAPVTSVGG